LLLLVLGAHNVDSNILASGEGVSENDKTLSNWLEQVSCVMISFFRCAELTKSQIF
jgi:hypothetical protein